MTLILRCLCLFVLVYLFVEFGFDLRFDFFLVCSYLFDFALCALADLFGLCCGFGCLGLTVFLVIYFTVVGCLTLRICFKGIAMLSRLWLLLDLSRMCFLVFMLVMLRRLFGLNGCVAITLVFWSLELFWLCLWYFVLVLYLGCLSIFV